MCPWIQSKRVWADEREQTNENSILRRSNKEFSSNFMEVTLIDIDLMKAGGDKG